MLVLAEHIAEGVRVQATGSGADAKHNGGAKDPLGHMQLPVVAAVVEGAFALDAGGAFAPVGMKVDGARIVTTEHHLLGAIALAPRPVVLDAMPQRARRQLIRQRLLQALLLGARIASIAARVRLASSSRRRRRLRQHLWGLLLLQFYVGHCANDS